MVHIVSRCSVCSNGTLVQKPELGEFQYTQQAAQPVHLMFGHRAHCPRMSKIEFVGDIGVTVPRRELKGSFKKRQDIWGVVGPTEE